jgi:hypothetical protein
MEYAVEMGSGDMLYVPSFIKIRSGIQRLWRDTQAERQNGDRMKSLIYFFK